jgi:hypothetical protein
MTTSLLITISLIISTIALAPLAAADDTCSTLPDRNAQATCYKVTSGTPVPVPGGGGVPVDPDTSGCNGGDKGYKSCGSGRCAVRGEPTPGERSVGCTQFVCDSPDWDTLTPEGGDNCLDMICRNIPPTIQFVQVTLAPHLTLLSGLIPGATIVRAIILNAGVWCEHGTGIGGPGNPCQRVLWTPAGSVGADPDEIVNTGGQTGTECSWAQSGVSGYNYVYDNGYEFTLLDGDCTARFGVVAVVGYDSESYYFNDNCTP